MWILLGAISVPGGEVVPPPSPHSCHPALPGVARARGTTQGVSALLSSDREKAGHHPVSAFSQCLLLRIVLTQSGVFWGWHRLPPCGMGVQMYL